MDEDLRALERKARAGDHAAAWALVRTFERLGSQGATRRWLELARLARWGDDEARRLMEARPHAQGAVWIARCRGIAGEPRVETQERPQAPRRRRIDWTTGARIVTLDGEIMNTTPRHFIHRTSSAARGPELAQLGRGKLTLTDANGT